MTDLSEMSWPEFMNHLQPKIHSATAYNITVGLTTAEWAELCTRCGWAIDDPEPMLLGLPVQIIDI